MTAVARAKGACREVRFSFGRAGAPLYVVQTGPHPVLDGAVAAFKKMPGVQVVAQCASLRRGAPAAAYLKEQRGALVASGVLQGALRAALATPGALELDVGSRRVTLQLDEPFPEQGVQSARYPALGALRGAATPGTRCSCSALPSSPVRSAAARIVFPWARPARPLPLHHDRGAAAGLGRPHRDAQCPARSGPGGGGPCRRA